MKDKHEKMKQIRDEVVALKESPIYAFRVEHKNHPVIGEGSHDAHFMFVGEAPGRNEAATGRPFCGTAGKILDDLLASIDIPRQDVYITNIVKDRPPENRDPLPSEIEIYGPFLDRQIEIIQPKVIVTLGRYSMNYIMQKFDLLFELEPISAAHGKTYQAKAGYGDITIVPMYHPAAAIYTQSLKETLKKDFQILKSFVS
ncbi:uracil-DNA glycosylase [Candidatus Kaiserbacteria bacterium RIFCSPHIGHO2_01_FULL_51_33]|uniref:Type-4 uracil-DNA glycosylase n=1 Tax=Candidatus Kaiserbacteria bacterium RIFCSPLOWO2_01_FULL_51_21 TaxID=1798508 RepID=A0A1F6EDI2_9BACT|nr:MAG: uracil-DNA glycosylase [Candidatus Kaiserbacteria bacterium RIFCSPHIGHO2_01_FULL_51_33]OGG71724.1 MAG: uracil-DNA glycosylase [Candidatus Kaiserbacteria bacterium RIFCSPLOWO2_01_FULL_51_21]